MHEVTGIAAKFGCYLLDNSDQIQNYVSSVIKEKEILGNLLINSGFDVVSSYTNWIHFNDRLDNQKVDRILGKRNDVAYRGKTTIPFDSRKNWIRLTVGPDLHTQDFMVELLKK